MTSDPRHSHRQPEPLPAEFSDAQRRVDEAISAAVGRSALPRGLADRVYGASASLLPGVGSADIRTQTSVRLALHRTVWARLSLAACVLLAAGVTFWFTESPSQDDDRMDGHGMLASLDEFVNLPQSSTGEIDNEVSYLLDTNEVTSFDMLDNEMSSVVSDFETGSDWGTM